LKISELIRARRSVRTFDGRRLTDEEAAKILDAASSVSGPYDIPVEWRILGREEYSLSSKVIVGAEDYIAGKMKAVPHAEEAFGYAFEAVALYALSLGLGTTCIAGTMDRASFEKAMELGDGEVMPCVSPLGHPAAKMSVREGLMRKGVGADSRLRFEELFFEGDMSRPLTVEIAGKLAEALELVRLAPSAVNKQPWRLIKENDRIHFYEKPRKGYRSGTGWDIQKIDMGIAMYHFEAGLREADISFSFASEDPLLPAGEDLVYIGTYIIR